MIRINLISNPISDKFLKSNFEFAIKKSSDHLFIEPNTEHILLHF